MMRLSSLPLLAGMLLPLVSAPAQTTVRLGGGIIRASKLLGDRVNPFDELYGVNVTQSMGPAATVSVAFPAAPKYQLRLEADLASTNLDVKDEDTGDVNRFGSLRTLTVLAMGEGRVASKLSWQAGIGQILYLPSEKTGFFLDGGPSRWTVAAGLTYPFAVSSGVNLAVTARYDYHQFITETLKNRGFTQFQAVHRVGVFLTVERAF